MPASNKTPMRVVSRPLDTIKDFFTDDRAFISKIISVANARQNGPDGLHGRANATAFLSRETVAIRPAKLNAAVGLGAPGIRHAQDENLEFRYFIFVRQGAFVPKQEVYLRADTLHITGEGVMKSS